MGCHAKKNSGLSRFFSLFSFILAWTFISLQIKEFRIMGLSINDSVYSSLFFFLTGLHFFHLLVGLLLCCLLFWSCSFSFKSLLSNPSTINNISDSFHILVAVGSVVWGHHMYTVGLETDTRAYFSGVTILISLPTGTKIFNWLSTYLGNPPLLLLRTSSSFFALLFLLMFTIGGSTGVILGNAAVDLGLHDTYYVVAHFP